MRKCFDMYYIVYKYIHVYSYRFRMHLCNTSHHNWDITNTYDLTAIQHFGNLIDACVWPHNQRKTDSTFIHNSYVVLGVYAYVCHIIRRCDRASNCFN